MRFPLLFKDFISSFFVISLDMNSDVKFQNNCNLIQKKVSNRFNNLEKTKRTHFLILKNASS